MAALGLGTLPPGVVEVLPLPHLSPSPHSHLSPSPLSLTLPPGVVEVVRARLMAAQVRRVLLSPARQNTTGRFMKYVETRRG